MLDETSELLRKINSKLGTLIALQLIEEKPEKIREKVLLLTKLGLENQEIASILNISSHHVAKEKSLNKRGEKDE